MGDKKALDRHWGARIAKDAENLEQILEKETKRRGELFSKIVRAAEFGAQELTKMSPEKKKPVSPSTLTRNQIYRNVLEAFVKPEELSGKSRELKGSERLKFQLQLKEKTQEVERLEKQLTTALEDRSKAQHRLGQSVSHDASQKAVEASFAVWKTVIDRLLKELPGAKFDLQKRTVEDELGVGTLLVEDDFPEDFFDWLKRKNQ